jgi:hypothetical protein
MFDLMIIAHGALGPWDEIIFLGVVAIFVGMMGMSWIRSRNTEPEFDETSDDAPTKTDTPATSGTDRFQLD